jgi:hypothetical protein
MTTKVHIYYSYCAPALYFGNSNKQHFKKFNKTQNKANIKSQ